MSTSDDLLYSPEASATRFLFYQGLNQVNLFVEDEGMEYEYETIFKRILGEQYCIAAIFSLGGKANVRSRYYEFGTCTDNIKNFYIVDGDFDRYIHKDEMIDDPNFIYLKTYNIENYFIDEYASEQFAKSRLKCMDSEVKAILNFQNWKRCIVDQSKDLFLCYCFVQKYGFEEPTLSRSPYEFIDSKTGFKRTDDSFQIYRDHVHSLSFNVNSEIEAISLAYEKINGSDYFNLICGKFLFCSLYCYLKSIVKSRIDRIDLRWYLINNFDVSKLNYLKDAIINAIS